MGATGSKQSNGVSTKEIFAKEFNSLNKITNDILTETNTFKNPSYNFIDEDVCQRYSIVLGSELKKHLRVDLEKLKDSIYFVPHDKNVVHMKNNVIKDKKGLCEVIATHYIKILYLLTSLKQVFDIENYGEYSLGSLIMKNIKISDGIFTITYCGSPQYSYDNTDETVDFEQLKGFGFFCNHLLDQEEKNIFLLQFRNILSQEDTSKTLEALACGDKMFTSAEYYEIYKRLGIPKVCNVDRYKSYQEVIRFQNLPTKMKVDSNAPIVSMDTCSDFQSVRISLVQQTSEKKKLIELYNQTLGDYKASLKKVELAMFDIVAPERIGDKVTYVLKDVTHKQLEVIIKKVKKVCAEFYLKSLINYKMLLGLAKQIPEL